MAPSQTSPLPMVFSSSSFSSSPSPSNSHFLSKFTEKQLTWWISHFRGLSPLIFVNTAILLLSSGATLLLRIYFIHGGRLLWLTTTVQVCGFPILLIPIAFASRSSRNRTTSLFQVLSSSLIGMLVLVGIIFASNSYLYALGSSYLPLSTSILIVSSQLAFTALFAALLVRQRFTAFSTNAVVLLTIAPIVLGLGSTSDMPAGETRGKYDLGFAVTVVVALLNGLMMPLLELIMAKWFKKAEGMSYKSMLEILVAIEFVGTVISVAALFISGDFKMMKEEGQSFGLGETKYYLVLLTDVVFWQLFNVGMLGLISCASSLLTGIVMAALLPIGEVLPVVFLHESFTGTKGVALVLSLWGFASYLYGEKNQNNNHRVPERSDQAESSPIELLNDS